MRAIVVAMMVFGLLGIAGASDKEKFAGLIAKYGSDNTGCVPEAFKPKAACYCTSGGATGVAGFLIRYEVGGFTYVGCNYPVFDATGSLLNCGACTTFQLLAK